jgi:putative PIN family toxin of toxin-antitoxin system
MITLVMNTNVLVTGLLSPHSYSARLVGLAAEGLVRLAFDERILAEYWEVLTRPKFPFHPAQVEALLDQIEEQGLKITPLPIAARLPDPDDLPFLEVAVSAKVDFLVTGNKRHYPPSARRGIRVLSPKQCLEAIARSLPPRPTG